MAKNASNRFETFETLTNCLGKPTSHPHWLDPSIVRRWPKLLRLSTVMGAGAKGTGGNVGRDGARWMHRGKDFGNKLYSTIVILCYHYIPLYRYTVTQRTWLGNLNPPLGNLHRWFRFNLSSCNQSGIMKSNIYEHKICNIWIYIIYNMI